MGDAELSSGQQKYKEIREAFDTLSNETKKEGALSVKAKFLVAVGIAVVKGCEPCIRSNILQTREAGATEEEILEACFVAVKMDGAPSMATTRVSVLKVLDDYKNGTRYEKHR